MAKPVSNRLASMTPEPEAQVEPEPICVNLDTTGRVLDLCAETVRAKVNAGELPGMRVGTRWIVNLRALDDYTYSECMKNVQTGGEL